MSQFLQYRSVSSFTSPFVGVLLLLEIETGVVDAGGTAGTGGTGTGAGVAGEAACIRM